MDNKVISIANGTMNGKNIGGEKEMVYAGSVVGIRAGKLKHVVAARAWMGRSSGASTVHASVWIDKPAHGTEGSVHVAGHGSAGGYGYHKLSAALDAAVASAGIKLKAPFDGVGDSGIEAAFLAIAKHLGYKNALYVSHGN